MLAECNLSQKKSLYFSNSELALAHNSSLPCHVAVIMDGNRRWAQKQGRTDSLFSGHWAGANALTQILEAASDLEIKILTVYGFSTENWGRTPTEVDILLQILYSYLETLRQKMVEQGVRFHAIGDLAPFSPELKHSIEITRRATNQGKKIDFIIALNYGGRDEIRRAMLKIAEDLATGKLRTDEICEKAISSYMDTAPFKDPDLLIRTSGEQRISNFLLWQLAYTEVYTTDILWPDFTPHDLLNAVLAYQKRQRRKGK